MRLSFFGCLLLTFAWSGCGEPRANLGPGETCVRSTECAPGLACVLGMCSSDLGPLAEGGTVPTPNPDGGVVEDAGDEGGIIDFDSGVIEMDAGPMEMDAGPMEMDAGPMEMDAGPMEMDAGPMEMDAGEDAGM